MQTLLNPKVYTKQFVAYARQHQVPETVEEFKKWDETINDGKTRAAIIQKYGDDALVEIAITELFKRHLQMAVTYIVKAIPTPSGGTKSVKPFRIQDSIGGVHIPATTVTQREGLIAGQIQVIKNATYRLQIYKLPKKELASLFDELVLEYKE